MFGFEVIERDGQRCLVVPIRDHCVLADQDHGWVVEVVELDAQVVVTIRVQLIADVKIPREAFVDAKAWEAGDLIAQQVVSELLEEAVPCHGPEIAAKVNAALASHNISSASSGT